MCPHKRAFVLSQGILGDADGVPKVSCPNHNSNFSLETGESISGEEYSIKTFAVKVEGDDVFLELEDVGLLDGELGTQKLMVKAVDTCGPCGSTKLEW